jgi:transcriptional regulator of acetoin/glycerol metabolism
MMREGTFREDLYYRLNGLAVRLPALRERRDLVVLIERILQAQGAGAARVAAPLLAAFQAYRWPGNLRQLTNVLRTACVLAGEVGRIGREQLPEDFLEDLDSGPDRKAPGAARASATGLRAMRADAVAAALQRNAGNVSATARALGVSRNTVYRAMRPAGSA